MTLNDLATDYFLSGQPRRAIPLMEMSNVIEEKRGEKKGVAIELGNVAQLQLVIGALSAAERNLRRSIDVCREIGDELWEAIELQKSGLLFPYLGRWQEAEQELSISTKYWEKIKGVQGLCFNESCRALRFLLMARDNERVEVEGQSSQVDNRKSQIENLKSAIEAAEHALELADEQAKDIPVPRDYVRAYWLLGAAYCAVSINSTTDELTLAEENLSKALNLCRQINLVEMEADILLDLARLRYAQGDFKDAQEKASEALVITERSGYVLQGADVNLLLATLAVEGHRSKVEGGLSDKEAALFHAREALKLATCDGPPYYYKVAYDEAERMIKRLSP